MKHTNQLIGRCGLDCEACDARIATITNDTALREKTAALWSKLNGVPITPDMMSCGHNCRSSPEIATEGRRKSFVRQVKKHMDFRITADRNERDIREIHEMLKK